MPGDGERFDIVVVGVQGDDDADGDLAADLSALTGLSANKVAQALREGELIVHRSMRDADARRAASSLRRLGARVEMRSTDELLGIDLGDIPSGGLSLPPINEPSDDLAMLLNQIRTPAPIAPPPEFGGAVTTTRNTDTRASSSASVDDFVDPSRPQGRLEEHASERPFAPAFEKATSRERLTPRDLPTKPRPRNGAERPAEERKPREPYVGTPRRAKVPEPFGVTGQIAGDAQKLAASLEAAAESSDEITVVTLDGEDTDSVEIKLGGAPGVSEGPPAPPKRPVIPEEDRLALDFSERAPQTVEAPVSASPPPPPPAPAPSAAASASASASATSGTRPFTPQMPSVSSPPTVRSIAPAALPQRRGLLSSDPIANYLFAIAIGLVAGVVVAFGVVRVSERDAVVALEDELAESAVKPIEVEMGELRRPSAIEQDLEDAYGGAKRLFVLLMLVIAAPIGFGLGFVKR